MSNRSSGRRRRGGRPSSNRGPNDGNRQSNRNPGNANQLLDKYKNMARDAHQQGDRVMNEYYLQFADHYFRVLADVNERNEQKRDREDHKASDDSKGKSSSKPRSDKQGKSDQSDRSDQADSAERDDARPEKEKAEAKPRRSSRAKSDAEHKNGAEANDALKISADALPGAIGVEGEVVNGKSEKKPTRSRSTRKPKDGDGATAEA